MEERERSRKGGVSEPRRKQPMRLISDAIRTSVRPAAVAQIPVFPCFLCITIAAVRSGLETSEQSPENWADEEPIVNGCEHFHLMQPATDFADKRHYVKLGIPLFIR